jgi:hypothetical protein
MSTLIYKKVGRRYVEIGEMDSERYDYYPVGVTLTVKKKGSTLRRYNVDPAFAPMIAAGYYAEDTISKHIMETSKLRVPERDRKQLTDEQRLAWENFSKAMGKEVYALEYCSYREAAEEGVKAMQEEAEKMMTHPAVKKAYEQFMMVWKLTKENEK